MRGWISMLVLACGFAMAFGGCSDGPIDERTVDDADAAAADAADDAAGDDAAAAADAAAADTVAADTAAADTAAADTAEDAAGEDAAAAADTVAADTAAGDDTNCSADCPEPGCVDAACEEAMVWETVQWTLGNPSYEGNPFDLIAKVIFTHDGTGERRVTEMFYTDDGEWGFRFTGTRTGTWTWESRCDGSMATDVDPDLHGHSGIVEVSPQTNPEIKGFLTSVGNKYAEMDADIDDLKGVVFQVYMNQQDFEQQYNHSTRIWDDPASRRLMIEDYWEDAQNNGFDVVFVALFYSWFKQGALDVDDCNAADYEAPDLEVFEALEYVIEYVHVRGGRVHIWAFGDNGRRQTANFLPGGVMGAAHQRIMRTIAARLGPLPGWSMNFGFDTNELPDPEGLTSQWAGYLQQRLGWPHLLGARGWQNPMFGLNSYAGFSGSYELETTNKGPASYAEIRADMDADPSRPHLYEERHTYERFHWVAPDSCTEPGEAPADQYGMSDGYACWPRSSSGTVENRLDVDGSRRLIWRETMAGGMGGFFGHFSTRFNAYGPFSEACGCGFHPPTLREDFRCFDAFWDAGRLELDMTVDNERVSGATGYAMVTSDADRFVFFVEDAAQVSVDLSGMPGSQPVVMVDAKEDYHEIDSGHLSAGSHTLSMGHVSDWAIAVGDFDAPSPIPDDVPIGPGTGDAPDPSQDLTGYVGGVFESGGQYVVRGWACHRGWSGSIDVHLYAGGPAGEGTVVKASTANVASEAAVQEACGTTSGAHRFRIPLTSAELAEYGGQAIYVHGISPVDNPNLLLGRSGDYTFPSP